MTSPGTGGRLSRTERSLSIQRCALAVCGFMFLALIVTPPAYADMGPPALFLAFGVMSVLVVEVVVVAIETPVLRHLLTQSWGRAFAAALAGNVVSAVAGIPLALWIGNGLGATLDSWPQVPGAVQSVGAPIIVMLVSLVASTLIEWPIVKWVTATGWGKSALAVVVANVISHVVIGVVLIAITIGH